MRLFTFLTCLLVLTGSLSARDPKSLPKPLKDGEKAATGEWVGKKVLPKRHPDEIRIGDWEGEKQVFWSPYDLMNCTVREDRSGFVRLHDGRREGWVSKDDLVTTEDAPAYFDKVVKADPDSANAWYMRAASRLNKGELDNAIKDLTEAIRLRPDTSAYHNCRGSAWADKKEYDKAIADYTLALKLDPKDALAFNNRGTVWAEKKDHDKAIADYTEALKLDPKFAGAYTNRGNTWLDKTEYDKAISDYSEVIKLDPKEATAFNNRGAAWAGKKQYDKAIDDYTQALRLDSKDATAMINRGIAWANKNEYDKALADYNEAIKIDPKSATAYSNLAWLYACCPVEKFRDGKKAVEYGTKLVELDPSWHCRGTLAAAYAEAGDFAMAVAEQRKAIDMLKAEKNPDADDLKKAEARLQLYRAKKPYRDEE